eukprot:gene6273-24394_t
MDPSSPSSPSAGCSDLEPVVERARLCQRALQGLEALSDALKQRNGDGTSTTSTPKNEGKSCCSLTTAGLGAYLQTMREALVHCGGTNLSPAHGTTALVMACELGAEEDVRALVEANGANIELAAMPGLTRVTMKASNMHRPHHPVPAFYTGQRHSRREIATGTLGKTTPLMAASAAGHLHVVRTLLELGADVHTECTELSVQSADEHFQQSRVHLTSWADAKEKDSILSGLTGDHSKSDGHAAIVHFLLEQRANPDLESNNAVPSSKSALYHAASRGHEGVVLALCHAGANPNLQTKSTGTPLVAAMQSRHLKVAEALLQFQNTNPNIHHGTPPLVMATEQGHFDLVSALLKTKGVEADINIRCTTDGATALFVACESGRLDIVKLLLLNGADTAITTTDDGATPLLIAARMSNAEVMLALLEHNANPNVTGMDGVTPLEVVSEIGDLAIVQALLDQNANPNLVHFGTGSTPIFTASFCGFKAVVSLMLGSNADPNHRDRDGATPMMSAAKGGHVEVMQLLASCGASTTVEDNGGDNPTRYAYDSFTVGRRSTLEWLAKVEHWSPLRVAAASRCYREARGAVKQGTVDPDLRGTWETLNVRSVAKEGSPYGVAFSILSPVCESTVKFVQAATSGWSMKTHWLHHPGKPHVGRRRCIAVGARKLSTTCITDLPNLDPQPHGDALIVSVV